MRDQHKATILALVLTIGLACCAVVVARSAQGAENPQTEGALWLSWSPDARGSYVAGYLRGFQQGKHIACAFYEENVAQKRSSLPGQESLEHSCMKSLPQLTEPYYQAYVVKITEYYRKYPNDREAGLSTLMANLATPPGLTIEEIHAKLGGASK